MEQKSSSVPLCHGDRHVSISIHFTLVYSLLDGNPNHLKIATRGRGLEQVSLDLIETDKRSNSSLETRQTV